MILMCGCVCRVAGSKEGLEKGPAQKAPVLQKGRFSVTSDDGDFEVLVCKPSVD